MNGLISFDSTLLFYCLAGTNLITLLFKIVKLKIKSRSTPRSSQIDFFSLSMLFSIIFFASAWILVFLPQFVLRVAHAEYYFVAVWMITYLATILAALSIIGFTIRLLVFRLMGFKLVNTD